MDLRLWSFFLLSTLWVQAVLGQTVDRTGSIRGTVTAADGSTLLPGAEIRVEVGEPGTLLLVAYSDGSGRFEVSQLTAGDYSVTASLDGFQEASKRVVLVAGQSVEIELRLPVAILEQTVDVTGERSQLPETGSSLGTLRGDLANQAPVRGDDFSSLLPLLPGVVRGTDGRLNLKGGQPTQSSLVVNSSTNVTDPSTGNFGFNLPVDAVASLHVLPNPYSAEFGRFSSGVTNILTQQGTNQWKLSINNFLPKPKIRTGSIMGIGGFTPRLSIRGPLLKDRLYLAQTFQYRYVNTKIPSHPLPPLERDSILESFASFTQLDANLGERHSVGATVSVFPMKLQYANLDTFNPQEVTPNLHQRGYGAVLSERFVATPSTVLESTISFKRYDVDVFGQGNGKMVITPDRNEGNFFNRQFRRTRTLQWVEQLNHVRESSTGQHVFKLGFDVLHASFDGSSESRPVVIRRGDGSVSQEITFSGPSSQRVRNVDLAFFGQDRWRLNEKLLLELGLRLDRDGVLERNNLAPRFGFVWSLRPEGRSIVRGGAGLFYDRTPLSARAFETYETRLVSYFEMDGSSVRPALAFQPISAQGRTTPSSFTWNLEYDHRLSHRLLFKANYLRRQGRHEPIVDLVADPQPRLYLDNRGRSKYWEVELTSRYDANERNFLVFSYVRSESEKDLNSFDEFYGNFRSPLIRPNQFSRANTDVPHRLLFQGTTSLPGEWTLSSVLEARSGFPYSLVNEEQEFVGRRNFAGRLPRVVTLDVDIQRPFKILGVNTRIGIRFFNLFNSFNPRDVQNNIDSQQFGTFYNTLKRIIGATLQFGS